jgi:hypothetical protein
MDKHEHSPESGAFYDQVVKGQPVSVGKPGLEPSVKQPPLMLDFAQVDIDAIDRELIGRGSDHMKWRDATRLLSCHCIMRGEQGQLLDLPPYQVWDALVDALCDRAEPGRYDAKARRRIHDRHAESGFANDVADILGLEPHAMLRATLVAAEDATLGHRYTLRGEDEGDERAPTDSERTLPAGGVELAGQRRQAALGILTDADGYPAAREGSPYGEVFQAAHRVRTGKGFGIAD